MHCSHISFLLYSEGKLEHFGKCGCLFGVLVHKCASLASSYITAQCLLPLHAPIGWFTLSRFPTHLSTTGHHNSVELGHGNVVHLCEAVFWRAGTRRRPGDTGPGWLRWVGQVYGREKVLQWMIVTNNAGLCGSTVLWESFRWQAPHLRRRGGVGDLMKLVLVWRGILRVGTCPRVILTDQGMR
jgi:hypothetical protein